MKFSKKLYVCEQLKEKQDRIVSKLQTGTVQLSCYIVALSDNPNNQLEFFDSILLLQHRYKKDNLFVVGIANCYEEAVAIVQQITEEAYEKNQNVDLRSYILEQQES